MAYTTVSEVAAELGGVSISTSSTPTTAQVESWISDAEAEIESRTGKVYSVNTVSTSSYEYHDYNGEGKVHTFNKPIISVTEISYEKNGYTDTSESWVQLYEGRTSDKEFIVYKDSGLIEFHTSTSGNYPQAGVQNLRIAYTYGTTSVPKIIKRLATLLVAKRYITTVANNTATDEGGSVSVGTISVTDPTDFSLNKTNSLTKEINDLYSKVVGDFQTFFYDDERFN